jgi:hypothetical protein
MADSKIDFSFDNLHFSCEGEKEWVERQLNQVLSRIPGLVQPKATLPDKTAKITPVEIVVAEAEPEKVELKETVKRGRKKVQVEEEKSNTDPLFQFLIDKNADKNQVRKFLAASVYLYASNGMEKFSTPFISKALKTAGIEKLINASDCLNKNEKKGFCIKDDKEFTLTQAGINSILGNE